MNEKAFQFGPANCLTGTLCTPAESDRDRPVVLILNAGVVHRSGPFRLHVDIARRLARVGFSSMRLDLSGLGDSGVRNEVRSSDNRALLDASDAMDFLESETGASRFLVVGLCSGAYNSHHVAVDDNRVVGAVFMDGLVYPTEEHSRRKRMRRLTRPRKVRNAIKRRLVGDAIEEDNPDAPDASEFFAVEKPASQVAREITRLLDRNLQLLFIYTEGYSDISSRDQFAEMFDMLPNEDQLQVDYYDNFEHTFRLAAHRETIVARVASWCGERFANAGIMAEHSELGSAQF